MQSLLVALILCFTSANISEGVKVSARDCDTRHLGDDLSAKHVTAIQNAVSRIKGTILILIISDDMGAGCHAENFLAHASLVSKSEGLPPIVHVALDQRAHARCSKLARNTSLDLDLHCASIAGHSGLPKKARSALGHASCWYRHVAWVKPVVLLAALEKAHKGILSLDVDVTLFHDVRPWIQKQWSTISSKVMLCQCFLDEGNHGIKGPVKDCNAGQLFFPAGDRGMHLLHAWAQVAKIDTSPAKVNPTWGNQRGLNLVLWSRPTDFPAYLLPLPEFSSCGQRSNDSLTVHQNMCGRFHGVKVFDDRTKLPEMEKNGVWQPFSTKCRNTKDLIKRAWEQGHQEL